MNTSIARTDSRPFLPSDISVDRSLIRAVAAAAIACARHEDPDRGPIFAARAAWPRDPAIGWLLTRGVSVPADMTTTGWAAELAAQAVVAFVGSLRPQSAAARLIEAGVQVNMSGIATAVVPWSTSSPAPVFVAEGAAIPVGQGVVAGATVGPPSKLAMIESFSRELAEHSADAAASVIGELMREAGAKALDGAVFSTAAADSTRPAGILAGITPIAATSGGGQAAMVADLDNLISAIVTAGGGRSIMIFVSPGRAVRLRALAGVDLGLPIISTPTLTATTIVAVEAGGFASGFNPEPDISVAQATTLHFEAMAPQQIGQSGSPTLPIRSLFQTDCLAFRLILRAAWAMRASGLVQIVNSCSW